MTDHGTVAGHREFQRAAKDAGIVGILGLEAYSADDIDDRRTNDKRQDGTKTYNHITLLAQNETGLTNLYQLSERAWKEGYYYKPRMAHTDICANNEGIFALSGCLGGSLCQAIERGDMGYANAHIRQYKEAFGDRYYIEVMSSNPVEMNLALLEMAKKHGVKPVATPDCHYARPEDLWFEEAMLVIQTNPKRIAEPEMSKMEKMDALERINYLYPDRTMTFEKLELYLKGYEDEATRFSRQGIERTDILTNTMEIAGRVGEYPYYESLDLLPKPKRPAGEILREQATSGMKSRGLSGTKYLERLEYELEVIGEKNFDVYFLIVGDLVRWAKKEGIACGPARGSAGGSLLCYLLNITDVDPIRFGLSFDRFLNRNRSDMPDVDLDFEDTRRGEVKEYLRQRYEYVASIATFPRFQGKSSIRSASSAMAVPIADVEKALKGNESGDRDYLDHFEESEQGKVFIERHPEAWELAGFIQGRIRSTGMHPAGVVVSDQELSRFMPIQTGKEPKRTNRVEYIGLDMNEVANIGGVKIDILGLKNLGVIKEALRFIKERNPNDAEIDLLSLRLDNKRTYKMLAEGRTAGVFQMEGAAFTKWIKDTKCDNFQDIVNGSAVARPGPMESIGPEYKAIVNGEAMAAWDNDIIRDITKNTYSKILFQEQISRFMVELAGMNPADAEDVRKSISKKKDPELIAKYRDEFVDGASKHISRKEAEKYWSDFEKHSGYSFNLSHSVAYSLISYWTAFLKANHTLEYMTALIGAEEDQGVRTGYLLEARRLGIGVDVPHINYAKAKTSIVNGRIMLGLTDIKYIASKAAEKIIAARPFASYEDLIEKAQTKYSGISSRVVDSLDAVGALQFPERPVDVEKTKSNFYEYLGLPVLPHVELTNNAKGKLRKLADYEESTAFVTLAMVKSIVSKATWARAALVDDSASAEAFIDVNSDIETGKFYLMLIAGNSIIKYIPLDEVNNSKSILMDYLNEDMPLPSEGGYRILAFRSRRTKKGDKMGSTVFVDHLGDIYTALVFPRQYQMALPRLQEGREVRMFIQELKDGGYCVAGFE